MLLIRSEHLSAEMDMQPAACCEMRNVPVYFTYVEYRSPVYLIEFFHGMRMGDNLEAVLQRAVVFEFKVIADRPYIRYGSPFRNLIITVTVDFQLNAYTAPLTFPRRLTLSYKLPTVVLMVTLNAGIAFFRAVVATFSVAVVIVVMYIAVTIIAVIVVFQTGAANRTAAVFCTGVNGQVIFFTIVTTETVLSETVKAIRL